jgi:hypothetical protein
MVTFANRLESPTSGFVTPLPLAKIDANGGRLLCSQVPAPQQPRAWREVPAGTKLILDFGIRLVGGISFEPTVSEILVLDGQPIPDAPANDGRRWLEEVKFPMLIGDRGLFMFAATGSNNEGEMRESINQRRIASIIRLWKLQPKAQHGLLQEFITRRFEEVPTAYGTKFALVWEPTGNWVERDEATFGIRLLPPPSPMMAPPSARAQIVNDNQQDESESDPAPPWPTTIAEPAPAPAPKAAAAAKTDPFATYRPSAPKQRPQIFRPR